MKPRTLIGVLLLVVGLGVTLYGLGSAIMELVGLYAGAMQDPMADPVGGSEKAVSDRMIRDAIIGACGVPPMLIGTTMLGLGLFGWIFRIAKKDR